MKFVFFFVYDTSISWRIDVYFAVNPMVNLTAVIKRLYLKGRDLFICRQRKRMPLAWICWYKRNKDDWYNGIYDMNYQNKPVQCTPRHSQHCKFLLAVIPPLPHKLYGPRDRRLSEELVPTFGDRGCHVVSVTDPYGSILKFLDQNRYFFFQAAPQLYSRVWVDPVSDPLLLRKSGSASNRTRDLWICSQELWPLDHRRGLLSSI
jgi:hypothetical protein